ncbi:MAG: hypothetical protein Q8L35_07285 [Actinomycetota bacterium]|nr:hypothetical protein [Actinomycetota bacterium]
MSAETLIAELESQGIMLAIKDGKLLSKPAIPAELIPTLKENKAEIVRALKWRQNVERLKATFGAAALTGPELLKSEYNFHLAELRRVESYLDDKGIPQDQREALIPELQRQSRKLSELLNCIGEYTSQEVSAGFSV